MAVARQGQGNGMLYTVVTFVALFVIAAACAVVFYIKAEDWRNQYLTSRQELEEFASSPQVRSASSLIGQKDRQQSRTGQLLGYIDNLYALTMGIAPQEVSAEVKLEQVKSRYDTFMTKMPSDITGLWDSNMPGSLDLLDKYHDKLMQERQASGQLQQRLSDLQDEYKIVKAGAEERESQLRLRIASEQEKADSVQKSYNQLRELMDKKADEQMQLLAQQRDEAIKEKDASRQELLASMSKLNIAQNRLKEALSRLEILKPRPKEDIAAYQPDGKIISVEASSDTVFIDLGSDAKVYPGLTFAVYDKSSPVPTDGVGKAEIEVFNVDKNSAVARLTRSSRKNPVLEGDLIINLVWDAATVNRFVVAGAFDFNGDGVIDADGADKIRQLIENWGGKVEDTVTIDTDFVVLGAPPELKRKPSLDEIEVDPMAMDKYEQSVRASDNYQLVKEQSRDLYIPVFGLKRFLNFIGYETIAARPN